MTISDERVKFGLKISVIEGCFAQIHINLTAGLFLTGFALYLGANVFQIGLLAAIPALLTSFGFLAGILVNKLKERRRPTVLTSGLARGLFLIPAVMLWFNYKMGIGSFLVLVGIVNGLLTIANNIWIGWMSDLVPKGMRGRYFGIRNTILGFVGMVISFSGARLLDYFKGLNQSATGFALIFSFAVFASIIAAVLLSQQPDVLLTTKPITLKQIILNPLTDKNFQRFLRFIIFWYLTSGIASPFYLVFMLKNLNLPYSTVALYGIFAGIMGLIFQILWGRAIDKFRSKPVLTINFLCVAFLPLLWLFPTRHFLLPIWLDAILTGVFWPGVNLALFNIVLSLSDQEEIKENYFAVFTFVTGIGGFISSTVGGFIANLLKNFHITIFGLTFINFHLLFIFATVSRLLSLLFLKQVSEPKAYPTLYALEVMGDYAMRRLSYGKELFLNTLRFLKPRQSGGG
uniref:MFS transporter n=1 Tax=candidate division WOR-3 bacterium TaxID=2052148 RepID=A0A7C6EDM1_UNCW3